MPDWVVVARQPTVVHRGRRLLLTSIVTAPLIPGPVTYEASLGHYNGAYQRLAPLGRRTLTAPPGAVLAVQIASEPVNLPPGLYDVGLEASSSSLPEGRQLVHVDLAAVAVT